MPRRAVLGSALALLLLAGCDATQGGAGGDGATGTTVAATTLVLDGTETGGTPTDPLGRTPASTPTTAVSATTVTTAAPDPGPLPESTAPPATEGPAPTEPVVPSAMETVEPAAPAVPEPTEPAPSTPPAPTAPPTTVDSSAALEGHALQFLEATNALRASLGLAPLGGDSRLVASANGQVDVMIGSGTLAHQDLQDELAQGWMIVGENVGYGPNVDAIHQALVASPGHYANLVNDRFSRVGIVVKADAGGRLWVAQVFGG